MNVSLLERYQRDPVGLRLELEAAARRERARTIRCLIRQMVEALIGAFGSRPSTPRASCLQN